MHTDRRTDRHTYIHRYTHMSLHTYAHTQTRMHIYVHNRTSICTHVHVTRIRACTHICMYIYIYIHIIYIYIYACVCVCVHTYVRKHVHRDKYVHADKRSYMHACRRTDGQAGIRTYIHQHASRHVPIHAKQYCSNSNGHRAARPRLDPVAPEEMQILTESSSESTSSKMLEAFDTLSRETPLRRGLEKCGAGVDEEGPARCVAKSTVAARQTDGVTCTACRPAARLEPASPPSSGV